MCQIYLPSAFSRKGLYFLALLTFCIFQTSPVYGSNDINEDTEEVLMCTTPPILTCPGTFFGCPNASLDPSNTGAATALAGSTDCPDPVLTYTDIVLSQGPCPGQVHILRVWLAMYEGIPDADKYTSECTQNIFLKDQTVPTIQGCPSNISLTPDGSASCGAVATWTVPTATDDCGLASFSATHQPGDIFPLGTTTVTYTAVDDCGNSVSCSFTVTVAGSCCQVPPTITCPSDYNSCPGSPSDPSAAGYATATSGTDCGTPLITWTDININPGSCNGSTSFQRVWKATDPDNPSLFSTCIQNITLEDNTTPVIQNCPTNITVAPDGSANCGAVVSWTVPTATDNCNVASMNGTHSPGTVFPSGSTIVSYTAIDNCGNLAICSFTVTVSGSCCTDPPTITCPTDFWGCPSVGTDPATTGYPTAAASDGCGDPIITYTDINIVNGTCAGSMTFDRVWKATDPDNSSLFAQCIQTISLEDLAAPSISLWTNTITASPDGSPDCGAVVTWQEPVVTDDCGLASVSSNYPSGTVFPNGTTIVTYTATDLCGQVSSSSFTVNVVGDCCSSVPVITCPTDFSGCVATSTDPTNTGYPIVVTEPGCADPIISYVDLSFSMGDCDGEVSFQRRWKAEDPADPSLFTTCIQNISLNDNFDPEIWECPADITVEGLGGYGIAHWILPTATDDCGIAAFTSNYSPGDTFPVGTTTVEYFAEDNCWNSSTCTFTVTVEDLGGNVSLECPDDIYVDCQSGDGSYVTWEEPTFNTSCGDCGNTVDIPGYLYMGTYNGHRYYCSYDPAPWFTASALAQAEGGYLARINDAGENAFLASILTLQSAYIGGTDHQNEGNWVWSDGSGFTYTNWYPGQPNNYYGSQNALEMLSNGLWNDQNGEKHLEYIMEIPCSTVEQIQGPANGSSFPVGTTTVKYRASDACGNVEYCEFTVTVEESMSLICPDDIYIECDASAGGAHVTWNHPTIESCCEDDCSGVVPGEPIPGFIYMGTYGGSQYYCSAAPELWSVADLVCQANGGHLAIINSQAENAFLASQIIAPAAYIGLSDIASEGNFTWVDGTPISYAPWYPGQPNNYNNAQDVVELLNTGQWNDQYDKVKREYILEIPICNQQVTQISGPAPGSWLTPGTYTVTYSGTDACGNTDICSFNITVDTPEPTTCTSGGQSTQYMWIEHFQFGPINNTSGNNWGYADFTGDGCPTIQSGFTYPLKFTPGFASLAYTVYWKMWIDWNMDGDYLDDGEFVAYGSGAKQLHGNMTIPANVWPGQTTMRIAMKYGCYPAGPCSVFPYGETEDYCLTVAGGENPGISMEKSDALEMDAVASEIAKDEDLVLGHLHTEDGKCCSNIDQEDLTIETFKDVTTNVEEPTMTIYPNPAVTYIDVTFDKSLDDENAVWNIFDSNGKLVKSLNPSNRGVETRIDISNLQDGIYILMVNDGQKVLKQKFVKIRT